MSVEYRTETEANLTLKQGLSSMLEMWPNDCASIRKRRLNALAQFNTVGLPSRKIERWHYLDLRVLLTRVAAIQSVVPSNNNPAIIDKSIFLANGNVSNQCSQTMQITPIMEIFAQSTPYWLPVKFASDDIISQLNTAYTSEGWDIKIDDNVNLSKFIEIQTQISQEQSHAMHHFSIGKNSCATVIENYISSVEKSDPLALGTSVTRLDVAEGANVTWVIMQDTQNHHQLSRFEAVLARDASLTLYYLNLHDQNLIRQEVVVTLNGEGADFQLRCMNLLAGNGHSDLTLEVNHLTPHTTSQEFVRNIVSGRSNGSFQGVIRVDKQAQKTNACMACNSLILSHNAHFNTKPELEIFADDVICGHGATFTQINEDHLFYLMARGISETDARGLLVKAFAASLIDEVENVDIQTLLLNMLSSWLNKHL